MLGPVQRSLVLAFVIAFLAPLPCSAEWSFDIGIGGAFTDDPDLDGKLESPPTSASTEDDIDASLTLSFRGVNWFEGLDFLGVGIGSSIFHMDGDVIESNIVGNISPLLMFRLPTENVQPYAGIGPGLFISAIDSYSVTGGGSDIEDISFDVGVDFCTGVLFLPSDTFGIFLEYRFTYFEPDYKDRISASSTTDEIEAEFGTHFLMFGFSIRWE